MVEGLTNTTSWFVFIDGDHRAVEHYLGIYVVPDSETAPSSRTSFQSFLTLQHETVHFWQGISTSFLFFFSIDHWELCLRAADVFARSKKRYSDIPTNGFMQEEFKKLAARFHISDAPSQTNALYVIEGAAVLCSYRLSYLRPSHKDFLVHLDKFYNAKYLIKYRHAYDIATSILDELAFDLFAPACYLALQTEEPGHSFDTILWCAKEHVRSVSREQIIEDPLTFLLNVTNFQEDRCFPLIMKYAMSRGLGVPIHSILQPYVERIVQAADDLRVCDFFARPYFYLKRPFTDIEARQTKQREFFQDILPPAHMYKNVGRALRTGLGRHLGYEYIQSMINITTIVHLVERLFGMGAKSEEMYCHHSDCPINKTRLCQGYYAYPDDDFRKCQFPEFLRALKMQSLLESIPNYKLLTDESQ